jgi:hypothetical protein
MNSFLKSMIAVAATCALQSMAVAAPVYLTFSGNNANGELNGNAFTGASWTFEYAIDSAVADGDTNSQNGWFMGAISGGQVSLNGDIYALAGGSATGNVSLASYNGAYDGIFINPTSGGYLQFITGKGSTFPALFADVNNLQSANLGTTVFDVTTDPYNNSSYLNYQRQFDWMTWQTRPGVTLADGGWVNLFEASGAASGHFSVGVSGTPMLAMAGPAAQASDVPEPGTTVLAGLGLLALTLTRRRRPSA